MGLFLGLLTWIAALYTNRYGGPLLPAYQWVAATLPYQSWDGFNNLLQFGFGGQ